MRREQDRGIKVPNIATARLSDDDVFSMLAEARRQYDVYVAHLPDLAAVVGAHESSENCGELPKYEAGRQLGFVSQR